MIDADLFTGMHNLHRIADVQTRLISAENLTGEKAKAEKPTAEIRPRAELGVGWKVSPCMTINAGQTLTSPTSRARAQSSTSG